MLRMIGAVAALVVISAAAAQAQVPVSLELRGGAAFPTQDLGDATLKTGAGFEGVVMLRVMEHLNVYGGWNWYSFVMDEAFHGTRYDLEDTGYNFGLRFAHPVLDRLGGYVQFGGVYKHIELENDAGDIVADSGHELGWEVGGGLVVPLRPGLDLTPGVRYRTYAADITIGNVSTPVDLSYVAAELGITWTPGAPRGLATARR